MVIISKGNEFKIKIIIFDKKLQNKIQTRIHNKNHVNLVNFEFTGSLIGSYKIFLIKGSLEQW